MTRCLVPSWLLLVTGCATGDPSMAAFDQSAGYAEVHVGGDDFGVYEGQRQPLDQIVLRLRWRTRELDAEARSRRFVVRLLLADGITPGPGAERAQQAMDRMIAELQVMGVLQVRYL
jgi:hypothetical protein